MKLEALQTLAATQIQAMQRGHLARSYLARLQIFAVFLQGASGEKTHFSYKSVRNEVEALCGVPQRAAEALVECGHPHRHPAGRTPGRQSVAAGHMRHKGCARGVGGGGVGSLPSLAHPPPERCPSPYFARVATCVLERIYQFYIDLNKGTLLVPLAVWATERGRG